MNHLRRIPASVLLAAGIVCAGPAGALTGLSVFTSATARSADDLESESDMDNDDVADALSASSNASVSPNAASTHLPGFLRFSCCSRRSAGAGGTDDAARAAR